MNIAEWENQIIEARSCRDQNKRIAYTFMDGFHSLCLNKSDMMLAEIGACEILMHACRDDRDRRRWKRKLQS